MSAPDPRGEPMPATGAAERSTALTPLPPSARRPPAGRWRIGRFLGLGIWDWIFVLFGWLTVFYAIAIVAEAVQTGDWDIDYMPITAGIPFILVGWRAVRVSEQGAAAVARLDEDAGLVLAEGDSFDLLRMELARGVRNRRIGLAVALALLMTGVLIALVAGGQIDAVGSGWIILLGPVLVTAGAALGALVGGIWGNGRLLRVLDARGAHFAGVLTRETRRTLARMKSLFALGFWATTILCHWFIAWFGAWALGLGRDYVENYAGLFCVLFAVSLILFYFAGYRPIVAFLHRLEAIYGGRGAQDGVDAQLRQARQDLERLQGRDPPAEADLKAFIAEKGADPIGKGVLSVAFARGVLAWQILCFIGAGLFTYSTFSRSGPVAPAAFFHVLPFG